MNYVPPRRSDGTLEVQRIRQPWPKDRPFRILSIDGGGICGILPASVLAELECRFPGAGSDPPIRSAVCPLSDEADPQHRRHRS